jgi:hypothetical protein
MSAARLARSRVNASKRRAEILSPLPHLQPAELRKFTQAIELGPPRGQDPGDWRRTNQFMILRVHLRQDAWPAQPRDTLEIMRVFGNALRTAARR